MFCKLAFMTLNQQHAIIEDKTTNSNRSDCLESIV